MDRNIPKILKETFPGFSFEMTDKEVDLLYKCLNAFAKYTLEQIGLKNEKQIKDCFDMIDKFYQSGTLYEKNAVENEYLLPIANQEKTNSLMKDLKYMPKTLREIYIEIIIQN